MSLPYCVSSRLKQRCRNLHRSAQLQQAAETGLFVSKCILDRQWARACIRAQTFQKRQQMPLKPPPTYRLKTAGYERILGGGGCCVVMLAPFAYFASAGRAPTMGSARFSTTVPIALCIGAHLVMLKFKGRGCHGRRKQCYAPKPEKMTTKPPEFITHNNVITDRTQYL